MHQVAVVEILNMLGSLEQDQLVAPIIGEVGKIGILQQLQLIGPMLNTQMIINLEEELKEAVVGIIFGPIPSLSM